ncbi:hypothetical protein [uncultured Bacteroides sp.]|jgi:hypothetical protein|uniref:hypothetical protein n=1 Tax=uncultured Bacteroides sp. TaxID=162156 RepID=UPI00206E6F1A|nr:MAG TPA: hypothetical protein [Caudoviricetes sp.]
MDKKFITAQEANEKAKAYSDIERICEQIERAAENGNFRTYLGVITPKDQAKLEMLGYTVTENPDGKFPISISWK